MPPWFADPHYGPYLNDRSLSEREIDTIATWADAGAPEGAASDAPPAVRWPEGWAIKPDIIVEGPTTDVPASPKNNVVEWITVIMPSGFTKDTWVTSVQIKPEFPEVTHHMCISYVPHNPSYKYGVAYWADKERDSDGSALPDKGPTFLGSGTARSSDDDPTPVDGPRRQCACPPPAGAEDCYLPGNFAADYRPINAAKLIPAGSDITFNLHYTPNGKAVTDHVKVGFTVIDKAPERRYLSFLTTSPTDPKRFAIPPNTPNWESPSGRGHVPAGRRAGVPDAAHARARQGHDLHPRVSRRKEAGDPERAALRLQLAAGLQRLDQRAEGHRSSTSTRTSTTRRATSPIRIPTRPSTTER